MNTTASPDHSEHELCNLLTELIRIDTSNPPGRNYLTCVHFLEQQLQRLGMETRTHQVPPELLRRTVRDCETFPRHILVGRWDVGAAKTVHFNAHYDVVPAGDGWASPPFEPEIRDGWIYGRGANDMKGSLVALLHAFDSIQQRKQLPQMNVEVAFVPDEETNSLLGTGYLVDQNLVNADYVIVCEGGRDNVIGCGHNGVLWLDVTVKGKSAHAARPHLGINAFEKAAALCRELETYKAEQQQQIFTAPGGERFTPTLALGGEAATGPGSKINVIPEQFTFTIDRRVLPNENLEKVERELRQFLQDCTDRIPDLDVDVRTRSSRRSSLVSENNILPQAFFNAAKRHRPEIGFGITSGFTDMSFYANEAGLPTIGYGVSGKNTHGVDECVSIEDLVTVSKIYADFLTSPSTQ